MKGYLAFVKKEFTENIKNDRFLILFAVFVFFGMASAFLAKYMPQIIAAFGAGLEATGTPTALDAWRQFYKNISGVGYSAFLILFGSCMSGEYAGGTLLLLVTRGLPRPAVVLAKYTVAAVLMTVCFWAGFGAAWVYTGYLWPGAGLAHVGLAAFFLWMAGFLYLGILMLGCVAFRQTFTCILFTGGVVALLSVLGLAKPLAGIDPLVLMSKNVDLIAGEAAAGEFAAPLAAALVLTAAFLGAAVWLFNKKLL